MPAPRFQHDETGLDLSVEDGQLLLMVDDCGVYVEVSSEPFVLTEEAHLVAAARVLLQRTGFCVKPRRAAVA